MALERPEIIISLATRTVHLFDRATGFSRVYPAGPGTLNVHGRSRTPVGFFKTGPQSSDGWFYMPNRTSPDYFGGFPFLRLTALNTRNQAVYGLHGPISFTCADGGRGCEGDDRQWYLRHDYVSHGCVRMAAGDIIELFGLVRVHPNTPVAIIHERELDADGNVVDLHSNPALFAVGDAVAYGSCGARSDPYSRPDRWPTPACSVPAASEPE